MQDRRWARISTNWTARALMRAARLFTAPLTPEAPWEKYDPMVPALVGLLRYGTVFLFDRLPRLQAAWA